MFNNPSNSSEDSLFDQATEFFRSIRNYPVDSANYISAIIEVIKLCQKAIQEVGFDGDAHVLLANAYLLAALSGAFTKSYPFFLARAASVIEATKTDNMPIRNREIAEKIYRGVVDQLSIPLPSWVKDVQQLPKDMRRLHKQYYEDAINPLTLDEMMKMLNNV
ncbi:MAG: hypothetical protein HYZ22_15515 [Chloroflexi bacterium]|nr:hypothetical protein [Chloroflexota bacterium]